MTDLAYVDVRPVLAKIADLERELVFVGGPAVNFWPSYYESPVPEHLRARLLCPRPRRKRAAIRQLEHSVANGIVET